MRQPEFTAMFLNLESMISMLMTSLIKFVRIKPTFSTLEFS